jgi:hypothetical protein
MNFIKASFICALLSAVGTSNAVTLSDFSNFETPDPNFKGATIVGWTDTIQDSTTFSIKGTDFSGNYAEYYFSDFGSPGLALTNSTDLALNAATLPNNATTSFSINLFSGTGTAYASYSVSTALLSSTSSTIVLSVGHITAGFDWNNVDGFKIVGGGMSGDVSQAFGISFNDLSTFAASPIPEPATYAALLGLGGLGFAVYLRRRSVA